VRPIFVVKSSYKLNVVQVLTRKVAHAQSGMDSYQTLMSARTSLADFVGLTWNKWKLNGKCATGFSWVPKY